VFRAEPQIEQISTYSVSISIENALNKMTRDDKEHFVRGEILLLEVVYLLINR
jgi:hypothetical protein